MSIKVWMISQTLALLALLIDRGAVTAEAKDLRARRMPSHQMIGPPIFKLFSSAAQSRHLVTARREDRFQLD